MTLYYIMENKVMKPVDLMEWAYWSVKSENRHIRRTDIHDKLNVSTIFLGFDHSGGIGRPQFLETAVCTSVGWDVVDRYETIEEAIKGHDRIVAKLKELSK